MKRYLVALALPLALASCGGVPTDNLAACAVALSAAGSASPSVLLQTALATPACQALASDVLQQLIGRVSAQQYARGFRG